MPCTIRQSGLVLSLDSGVANSRGSRASPHESGSLPGGTGGPIRLHVTGESSCCTAFAPIWRTPFA